MKRLHLGWSKKFWRLCQDKKLLGQHKQGDFGFPVFSTLFTILIRFTFNVVEPKKIFFYPARKALFKTAH